MLGVELRHMFLVRNFELVWLGGSSRNRPCTGRRRERECRKAGGGSQRSGVLSQGCVASVLKGHGNLPLPNLSSFQRRCLLRTTPTVIHFSYYAFVW